MSGSYNPPEETADPARIRALERGDSVIHNNGYQRVKATVSWVMRDRISLHIEGGSFVIAPFEHIESVEVGAEAQIETTETLEEKFDRFLKASYLYYVKGQSTSMTDAQYDFLSRELLENWEDLDHPDKDLISKDNLRAGTGFSISESQYPEHIKEISNE